MEEHTLYYCHECDEEFEMPEDQEFCPFCETELEII